MSIARSLNEKFKSHEVRTTNKTRSPSGTYAKIVSLNKDRVGKSAIGFDGNEIPKSIALDSHTLAYVDPTDHKQYAIEWYTSLDDEALITITKDDLKALLKL